MKELEDYLFLLKNIKFEQDDLLKQNSELFDFFKEQKSSLNEKIKKNSELFYAHKERYVLEVLSLLNWQFSLINLGFGVFEAELISSPIDYQLVADYIPSRILNVDDNTIIVNTQNTQNTQNTNDQEMKCDFTWTFKSLYAFVNSVKKNQLKIDNTLDVREKIYQYNLITESNCRIFNQQ
jgi:hypothetical protein